VLADLTIDHSITRLPRFHRAAKKPQPMAKTKTVTTVGQVKLCGFWKEKRKVGFTYWSCISQI